MPRVLVLNHFAVPRGEPGGTRHVELFERLKHWDYFIIGSNFNPHTSRRVVPVAKLGVVPVVRYSDNGPMRILNWVSYAFSATARGLREGPADIVYGSTPHMLAPLAGWLLAKVKRAGFVLEVRDMWPRILVDMGRISEKSLSFRVLSRLESFLYSEADAIVVMAEGSRTALLERGIPDEKVVYIPNGADPADFYPSQSPDVLRARYGFTRFTAVYAGAHGPANGLDLLLDAASSVPEADIVLVGGGVLKEHLRRRCQIEELTNVRFLSAVPKSEVPDLLAAADLGLHVLADVPLFRDSVSPNKIFDYMAAGLPILTNSPGLVEDWVRVAGAGVAVAPTELSYGLRQFLRLGRQETSRLGENGKAWIERNQSRSIMAERIEGLLESVMASHRRA